MAVVNNEAEFRKQIEESIRGDPKAALASIPDELKRAMKMLPQHVNVLAKCLEEKPYDLGALKNGIYCAIELKNVTDCLAFNINRIEKHQIKALKQVFKCGGLSYCLCRFRKGLTKGERKRLNTQLFSINTAFALPIQWIVKQKEKSLPIELLYEQTIVLPYNPLTEKYDLDVLWTSQKKKPS